MNGENAIPTLQSFKTHYLWLVKMQYPHYDPKPTLFISKIKIQYPYVKHGTFLMQIYVLVQSIQGEKKFLN
jgi:hypothetical protein